jgi:dihydroorotase
MAERHRGFVVGVKARIDRFTVGALGLEPLRARGVVLDLGHGSGAFSFSVAEALLAAGLRPVISSDAHQLSINGPMFDLATCLTKLLALGLDLDETIAAATVRPARAIGRDDLGTLRAGAPADVAVLALEDRPLRVADVTRATRLAPRRLRVMRVFARGRELARGPLPPPAPWVPLSTRQAAARRAAARGEDVDLPVLLADPRDLAPPPLVGGAAADEPV